jgi:hypothetical protein
MYAISKLFIPRLIQAGAFPFDWLGRFYEFDQIKLSVAYAPSGAVIKPVLRMSYAKSRKESVSTDSRIH